MKRQRLEGIEKEISRVISKVLLEEVKNPKIKGVVSVTKVAVTEDLKFADVYFSYLTPLAEGEDKDARDAEMIEGLNEIKSFLRKRVAAEMELRHTPEIRVKMDDSIEYAAKMSKLLDEIKGQ